jgi:hypothetical protein
LASIQDESWNFYSGPPDLGLFFAKTKWLFVLCAAFSFYNPVKFHSLKVEVWAKFWYNRYGETGGETDSKNIFGEFVWDKENALHPLPQNMLAVDSLRHIGTRFFQISSGVGKWYSVPICIARSPLEHADRVCEDNVLLQLGPAHAHARMTAVTPTDDY